MRNYSEIGCLTLLGVTLTVYVAVSNCQPENSASEWPQKNINAEVSPRSMEKTFRVSGNKQYFLTVSTRVVQSNLLSLAQSTLECIDVSDVSQISFLSFNNSDFSSGLSGARKFEHKADHVTRFSHFDQFIYKNPLLSIAGEIRAGPVV